MKEITQNRPTRRFCDYKEWDETGTRLPNLGIYCIVLLDKFRPEQWGAAMQILFIQTGGTIDKDYLPGKDNHGYNFQISEPAITSIATRAKCGRDWLTQKLLRKDSLDMSDKDRAHIRGAIDGCGSDRIVVTHGTDTIRQTAEALSKLKGKTIVLTGAMVPEKFRDSDADFNVGVAVGAVQCLPPGVYIALYGEVVPWSDFVPR